ncbi:T9SS type A sorting domain-containing protein [Crocinitomix catalasitica]|uniref:T9SS type A sorting domain-containing protein n=1 Tax=Crocinitomix catalasitica TaxID=184607 RepID=UPI00048730D6|nr:T9SS type A sorting domain-containing protein [Crocinitomix catalasitica]
MKNTVILLFVCCSANLFAQFAPAVDEPGTTAIHKDSSDIKGWATKMVTFNRGLEDIINEMGPVASFGESENALGYAEGTSTDVVSLGDYGSIVLGFEYPIMNGAGNDFAVFENSFSDTYLEFAHVEVSTDGVRFVRIPSTSVISTDEQVSTYGTSETSQVHNLAGKYRQGYGTPFDLEDIIDSTGVNLDSILYVKIIDVIGTIDPEYASRDHLGNIINDPYETAFASGGFDLDAVAVMNENNVFAGLATQKHLEFKVYPNPTRDIINITSPKEVYLSIQILDLNGRIVSEMTPTTRLSLVNLGLQKGIYFVRFISDNSTSIPEKIVYF